MVKAIFIDAGHGLGPTGAIDNGAGGNGTTERKEVVEIAQELFTKLTSDPAFAGMEIIKIGVDERLALRDHIAKINDLCRARNWTPTDALIISIHLNSGASSARGLEAWYSPQEDMLAFARALVENISATTGLPLRSRPTLITSENRFGRLGIIDDTIARGCLIEAGFVTNEFDAAFIKDQNLDDKIAEGIQRALRSFLSLPAITPAQPLPDFHADVPVTAWYHDAVKRCTDEGLFVMAADGKFHPERPVTRAELAAVMARHLFRHHGIS